MGAFSLIRRIVPRCAATLIGNSHAKWLRSAIEPTHLLPIRWASYRGRGLTIRKSYSDHPDRLKCACE